MIRSNNFSSRFYGIGLNPYTLLVPESPIARQQPRISSVRREARPS